MKLFTTLLFLAVALSATAQNALRFDGANDYVQAPLAGPTGNASRTVEAWVNIPSTSTNPRMIVNWGDMANGQRFALSIINGYAHIDIGGGLLNGQISLSLNVWHHIAGLYDASNNEFRLYVDGVLDNTGTPAIALNTTNINGITIGRKIDISAYFAGYIDEVRVWNSVRSAAEIMSNMNSELCAGTTGLAGYYNFNQGVAGGNNTAVNSLIDLSGNNNNGVLNNFALTGATSNWVAGQTLPGGSSITLNEQACNSYTSPSGLYTYTMTGVYYDTIPSVSGCDSIFTINLIVFTIDSSVTQVGGVLTANQTLGAYQWLDCNNGYAPIPGATSKTFIPTVNGSYAVKVTKNICVDTSACYQVVNASIAENNSLADFTFYPNPANGFIKIKMLNAKNEKFQIRLIDVMGRVVFSQMYMGGSNEVAVDLGSVAKGVYQIIAEVDGSLLQQKILIR